MGHTRRVMMSETHLSNCRSKGGLELQAVFSLFSAGLAGETLSLPSTASLVPVVHQTSLRKERKAVKLLMRAKNCMTYISMFY